MGQPFYGNGIDSNSHVFLSDNIAKYCSDVAQASSLLVRLHSLFKSNPSLKEYFFSLSPDTPVDIALEKTIAAIDRGELPSQPSNPDINKDI